MINKYQKSILNPNLLKRKISLGLLVLAGCVTTEYNVGTHRQDIMFFSTEKEVALGQNVARQIAEEYTISTNPYHIERINRIGQRIAEVCDRREISYYFYVIEKEDEKNAFAVPGGYLYIFEELFEMLNDEELAYVLAHEVGHIVSRHSIKRLQAAMGYNFLILAATQAPADSDFVSGLSFALAQIMAGYSREDELNADELAIKYCKMTGFDPLAGIESLEKLYQEDKKTIRPLSYFRTHPHTAHRVRHIKEVLHLPLSAEDYINY